MCTDARENSSDVISVDYGFHKELSEETCAIIPGRSHSSLTCVNSGFNILYVCRYICPLMCEINLSEVTRVD